MFPLNELYYNHAGKGLRYTSTPSLRLDFDRAIRNETNCFIDESSLIEKKPKKLIFSDCMAFINWNEEKFAAVKACFSQLRQLGFEIYFWKSGRLVLLTKDNWNSLEMPPLLPPQQLIAQAIKQKQLSQDTIFLIDDYWLERLLNPNKPSIKRKLYLSSLAYYSSSQQKILLSLLSKAKPKLEEIIMDEFSKETNEAALLVKDYFPNYKLSPAIESIKLSPTSEQFDIAIPLIAKQTATVKYLEINHYSDLSLEKLETILSQTKLVERLQLYDCMKLSSDGSPLSTLAGFPLLAKLKSLDVSHSDIDEETLLALLEKAPHLEEIHLADCEKLNESSFGQLSARMPAKLKNAYLQHLKINGKDLKSFLEKQPALKVLDINRNANINSAFAELPSEIRLNNLSKLTASYSNMSANDVKALLEKAANLEELHLIECMEVEGGIAKLSANTKLKKLKTLYGSKSTLSLLDLSSLMEKAPNLQELHINNCSKIQSLSPLPFKKPSPRLNILSLSDLDLSARDLRSLLTLLPNLSYLNLEKCNNFSLELFADNNKLALEHLILSESNVNASFLHFLLKRIPHLQALYLRYCKNINNGLALSAADMQLSALKILDASYSNIRPSDLKTLLAQAENLEVLTLNGTHLGDEMSALPIPSSLPKLKNILLYYSSLSKKNLMFLCQISPNLEELHLNGCQTTDSSDSTFLLNTQFEALKILEANSSNIDLSSFLIKAPNLESLNLQDCKENIRGCFAKLPANSLFLHLKKVDCCYSNISALDVKNVLARAPKLKELDLRGCPQVIDFIAALDPKLKLPYLKHLRLPVMSLDEALLTKLRTCAPNLKLDVLFEKKPNLSDDSTSENHNLVSKRANTRGTLDADTAPKANQSFTVKRIFYSTDQGPNPKLGEYRLESFDSLYINPKACAKAQAFELYNQSSNLQLSKPTARRASFDEFKQIKDNFLVYGKQHLNVDADWQAIASLSAQEEMLAYQTTPVDASIELMYSQRDNLYYIRNQGPSQAIRFEFLLKMPAQKPKLPSDIQTMVNDFLKFSPKALNLNDNHQVTGKEYLQRILKEKVGACRHRALAFKAEMKRKFPNTPTRILINDYHAFVEVFIQGQWLACDLGGYPTKLEITEELANGHSKVNWENVDSQEESRESLSNKYDKRMETWSKDKTDAIDLLTYRRQLLQPSPQIKKTLIELESNEAVTAMALNVQRHCLAINRPVFYINSAEEIVCKRDFLQKEGQSGRIVKGPGGALYDFLTQSYSKDKPPVLIVNYANFSSSEIVQLHSLLDKERRADGIKIPEEALLIGIMNTKAADVYEGSDFYSRFDKRDHPNVDGQLRRFLQKGLIPEKSAQERYTTPINLYHGQDWRAKLLGRWNMTADGFHFEEGSLKAALAKGRPIEIQNGLWNDPEFNLFWQEALHLGQIRHNGEVINTKGIQLIKSEGYPWESLKKHCQFQQELTQPDTLLNPSNLGEYFATYNFISSKKILAHSEGLIEKAAKEGKKTLSIYLTRSLSKDAWARLLDHCKHHKIRLQIKLAPQVEVPKELKPPPPVTQTLPPSEGIQIIQSLSPDQSIQKLCEQDPSQIVIDVSECKPSDLLIQTTPRYNKKSLMLEFTQRKQALLKALESGKRIILTGTISDELADALAPIILKREGNLKAFQGKLSIVSKNIDNLRYAASLSEDLKKTKSEELSVLRTKAQFPRSFKGFQTLHFTSKSLGTFNEEKCLEETKAFHAKRNQLIFNVLSRSPYVFIAGLSGVGKTSFVEKELMKGITHKTYFGEHNLEKWALDSSACPKFLFIDEANLSTRQWSDLEGLFYNKPPTLLINGQLRTLSSQHKIIFAGNPVNYSDDRELAPFFMRHGRAVIFEPLPLAVIFEQILKPVFENTALSKQAAILARPMFDAYSFLCAQSTIQILISPRELQMMALLTLSYCKQNPQASPPRVAAHYAYEIGRPLVPAEKIPLFEAQFGERAPAIDALALPLVALNSAPSFTVTPSRLNSLNRLQELLILRQMRSESSQLNQAQRVGGLGGIILEGDSSVGKSAMVLAVLRAHGFEEVHELTTPAKSAKPFYRMNVSMPLNEKEQLLIKAFYEGAVVVIDEINSSPMMERLLNDLLMGKLPNQYKKSKQKIKAGFMIIGTQNPVTFAGRKPRSTALSRRLCLQEVPIYPFDEILQILVGKERYSNEAMQEFELLIDAFLRKSEEAKQEAYLPAPTLRQVLFEADKIKLPYPPLKDKLKNESKLTAVFQLLKTGLFSSTGKTINKLKACCYDKVLNNTVIG